MTCTDWFSPGLRTDTEATPIRVRETSQSVSASDRRQAKCKNADPFQLLNQNPITFCPDEQLLIAYAERTLQTPTAQRIEHHMAACLPCKELCSRLLAFERAQNIRIFGDRYAALKELGHGGMGTVYQVQDLQTQEILALKLLRPELARDGYSLRRFENELRLASTITHPNICRSHSFGWTSESAYIVMEFIEGRTLRQLLRPGVALDVLGGLAIAKQICTGLFELHIHGIVHRDLKPENVIVTDQGKVVLVDFGLARLFGPESTASAALIGTPAYMAPEQIEGRIVGGHTDIYALGIMLYEMFTGMAPFAGENAIALALKQLYAAPALPRAFNPAIPELLQHGILRCMQKNPADRFGSVKDITHLFEAICVACMGSVGES